jgi:hypothetical protein
MSHAVITARPDRAPDYKFDSMSSGSITVFHKEGENTVIHRALEGAKGGTIDRPGKVRWDPTDTRPRAGRKLYPAGTYFGLLSKGSLEECAVWGAWLPQA